MKHRWSLIFISTILSAMLPGQLKALSPVDGRIGATSRSSIRIEASVAPRLGISGPATVRSSRASPIASFCIWSSSPLRRYTLTLHGEGDRSLDQPGTISSDSPANADRNALTRLSPGKPFTAIARSSIVDCDKPGSHLDLALDFPGKTAKSAGTALLILAPE